MVSAVLFVLLVLFDVIFLRIEKDEGAYAYAFRLVGEGLLPYHDFSYIESPALPYYYAFLLWAPGVSILSVRVLGAVTGLAGLLLLVRCAARAGGETAAALTALLLFTNAHTAEYFSCDVTYPLVTLLLALALTAALSRRSGAARAAMLGALLAIVGATKASMGLVAILWLGPVLWHHRGEPRFRAAGALAFLATLAVTVAPFVVIDPEIFRFNVIDVPLRRGELFPFMSAADRLDQWLEFGWGQKLLAVRTIALWHAPLVILASVMAILAVRGSDNLQRGLNEALRPAVWALLAGVALHVLVPFPAYPNYAFLLLPALTLPLAIRYAGSVSNLGEGRARTAALALPVALGALHLLSGVEPERVGLEIGCWRNGPDRELVRAVERTVPRSGYLLTDYLPAAVGADRKVIDGNEGGRASLMPNLSDQEALTRHVLNRNLFVSILREGRVQGVLLTEQLFERSFDRVPGFVGEVEAALARRYQLVLEVDPGVHFRYGRVRIFRLASEGSGASISPGAGAALPMNPEDPVASLGDAINLLRFPGEMGRR